MSTRATYQFKDERGDHTVYKHHVGYPQQGFLHIEKALALAWSLPRFEADEFAASFVTANKSREGGVRLAKNRDEFGDTEYHYIVTFEDGELMVEMLKPIPAFGDNRRWCSNFKGTLKQAIDEYCSEAETRGV